MYWPQHDHVENRAKRMHEMMARLDVDPLVLVRLRQGEAYAQARTLCLRCREGVACSAWLQRASEAMPAGDPDRLPGHLSHDLRDLPEPLFCASFSVLRSCRRTS